MWPITSSPPGYKLGKLLQGEFPREIGLRLFEVMKRYLKTARVIVQDGVQGESAYKTYLRCESIVTSAVAGKPTGQRVRSYAATDFMCREESLQTLLKLKVYSDLGLGLDGQLVFFVINSGYVGEYDLEGRQIPRKDAQGNPIVKIDEATGQPDLDQKGNMRYVGQGEKITVQDSKLLLELAEHRKIQSWIVNPIFGYLLPDPRELEEVHGMRDFHRRFNPLRFYTPEQILAFAQRDIADNTQFLRHLFAGQTGEDQLQEVINVWMRCALPSPEELRAYYLTYYGEV